METSQAETPAVAAQTPAHWFSIVFVVILGLVSMYFACAGWVIANLDKEIVVNKGQSETSGTNYIYQGIAFADIYEARKAIEQDKVTSWFEWVYSVPASLPLLITAIAFGILGGIASVIHKAIGGELQTNQRVTLKPLFGGAIGIMVLGITYVLPAALTVDSNHVRPVSLAFLCLYGGAFSNHIFLWLEEKIKTVFALAKRPASQ